ncbi:unnamed protein product, partial [Mesorhabditis spiculigera]
MDNIAGSEWLVFIVMMLHLLLTPGTKVEESFNVQATHDLIYHNIALENYDHHEFPGVVPRSFSGPVCLALSSLPARPFFWLFSLHKVWMLVFGRLVIASQFHFLFYASRTLPNVFALFGVLFVYQKWLDGHLQSAVRWATAFTFVFRCELVLLFAPLFLPSIFRGQLPLFGENGAIYTGISTALKALVVTVPVDSLLWGYPIWPEGIVINFNLLQNRSHEYGVSPLLWYFYSALPRALLSSIVFIPLGCLIDRRLPRLLLPPFIFISLYSLLPHKELRFIIYAFPLLSLPAAVFTARMWINKEKSWRRWALAWGAASHLAVNALISAFILYASARNYPGNDAVAYLQYMQRMDAAKPLSLHMDGMTCQTGVSRFLHLYPDWEYNKTENLTPAQLTRFDFLAVGSYDGKLRELVQANYTSTHRVLFVVPAFHGVTWRKLKWPSIGRYLPVPLAYPEIQITEKIAVLRRKD